MNTLGTITHIVLTQWRSDAPSEALVEIKNRIQQFPGEIPGVLSVVEGASVSPERLEAGFEWALVVTYESAGAVDGYLEHPAHAAVGSLIDKWAERVVVFDLNS